MRLRIVSPRQQRGGGARRAASSAACLSKFTVAGLRLAGRQRRQAATKAPGVPHMASLHAVATLMGGKPLPNCRDAPHGVWHWIDPTGPTRPLTVDKSGNWNHGQLIAPPAVAAAQPAWLEALRSWREGCIGFLGLDESPVIFDDPQLTWTQTSFVHVQERLAHPTHTPGPPHTRHGRWRHGK